MVGVPHFFQAAVRRQQRGVMRRQQAGMAPAGDQRGDGLEPQRHGLAGVGREGGEPLAVAGRRPG